MSTQSVSAQTKQIVGIPFGTTTQGEAVDLYTLKNKNGMLAKVMTYGATFTELWVPDQNGKPIDVVLGFDEFEAYEKFSSAYIGCTTGRYANRIAGAKFTLDGQEYKLPANYFEHTLHGGILGFNKRVWDAQPGVNGDEQYVKFSYLSKDIEEGFPGNLATTVTYTLTDDNELKIDYTAKTDKPTILNLTNHAYFNLAGAGSGNVFNHMMQINADHYTEITGEALIQTGKIISVLDTPFDFRQPVEIGKRLDGAYDINYVLRSKDGKLAEAAIVQCPDSGLEMHVSTTEPALQLYTGIHLGAKGKIEGIGGTYPKYSGFCLEAQHYPDSIHHDNFPNTVLRPGETYTQTTVYKISPIKK